MKQDKKCSLIIRTKNEERWISSCLNAVFNQTYKNLEVIIVDNQSSDRTLEKARQFPIEKIVCIEYYLPGKSLNIGIEASSGEYIVCLSAHCIPVNQHWLENLVSALEEDDNYAGVYGRQEPMSFSTAADKRDLLLVFGLDKKVQVKDSFFHNANSIIKRSLWQQVPFDKQLTNIEDRVWAQAMLNLGLKIAYQPEASVYHYHGIHQNGNEERCANVVRIIETMQENSKCGEFRIEELNVVAIIPWRGKNELLNGQSQLTYTVEASLNARYVKKTIVSTDNRAVREVALGLGAHCPALRPKHLSEEFVGLEAVYQQTLDELEAEKIYPDLLVMLEATFPFRERDLLDKMIEKTLKGGFDTVIAARPENGSFWQEEKGGSFKRLDSGDAPRALKEKSYLGIKGLCLVSHPEFIRRGELFGNKVGLFEVKNPLSSIEIRDAKTRTLAEELMTDKLGEANEHAY
jgi:CMP-N-acetylneuraminic acid synthetase/GT2 family glycosyltransferase